MKELRKEKIIYGLLSFLGCWAIQLLTGITVRNPLTVVFFVLLLVGWNRLCNSNADLFSVKKPLAVGLCIAGLGAGAAVSFFRGRTLAAGFDSGLFKLMVVFIVFAGVTALTVLLLLMACKLLGKTGKEPTAPSESVDKDTKEEVKSTKKLFLISMICCFICYLPYFLYEFPGIMTADSLVQFEQIRGVRALFNHHPVVHTLLMKVFYSIGLAITGDVNTSVAFYTVFQMLFMAACCGRAVCMVDSLAGRFSSKAKWLALVFFALMPFNGVFAVTLWKDVPFAGICILLVCHVMDMLRKESGSAVDYCVFALLGILFSLFRSNAWYAFVVWGIFFVIRLRKHILQAVISVAAVLIVVILIKGPVFGVFNIAGPDFTESLSVPLQQVAAVLVNDGQIPDSDMKLIEKVIDTTYIHELYVPNYADNIKELVRAGHPEVIEDNKGEYFRLWLRLGLKYPGDYVKAWYQLVGGYFYPDVAYKVGDVDGIMGNDLGLYWRPVIGGKIVIKTKEIFIKLSDFMPLYGMFWSIGAYTWALLICIFAGIYKKKELLPMLLMLLMVGTLVIASPVVDFRYGYGLVMTAPVWTAAILGREKRCWNLFKNSPIT